MSLLIQQYASKEITRRSFANKVIALTSRALRVAMLDGLEQGGVLVDELDEDDTATYNAHVAAQSVYISSLGDQLADLDTISADTAAAHARMWSNKTLYPMFEAGLLSANANEMVEWVLGKTEKHCKDCLRLAGQRHRRKTWHKRGLLPKSATLECGGFHCDCQLIKTTQRASGRF